MARQNGKTLLRFGTLSPSYLLLTHPSQPFVTTVRIVILHALKVSHVYGLRVKLPNSVMEVMCSMRRIGSFFWSHADKDEIPGIEERFQIPVVNGNPQ